LSANLDLGSNAPGAPLRSSLEWSGRAGLGLDRAAADMLLGRYSVHLGDDSSPLYGGVRGLRWETRPRSGPGLGWGLGLFHPYGAGDLSSPRLGADLRWSPASGIAATADAGTDGSWRLGTEWGSGRLTTALSLGHLTGFRDRDAAAVTQFRIAGSTFLYSRLGQWHGRTSGDLAAVGVRTGWHGTSLWLEETRGHQDGVAQTQSALGFFVPGRHLQWGARLQSTARSDRPATGVELGADLSYRPSDRLQLWLQSNTSQLGGDERSAQLLAGVSIFPVPGLELRAERMVRNGPTVVPWRVFVRRRAGANTTLGLFYAPVPIREGGNGARLGIEYGRSFDLPLTRPGRIKGQVLVGDRPCRERLAVLLDRQRRAWTAPDGQWHFDRVPAGAHAVRLDLAHLPAKFGVSQVEQSLRVSGGHTTEAVLQLAELGGVLGQVTAAADDGAPVPGEARPLELGGITISLSNGRVTATGPDGSFSFRNLEAGPYSVHLEAGTLPEGYELRGPASWDVRVADGADVTGADFAIAPIRRAIRFFRPDPKTDH
jgi:hypothetical protein